MKLNFIFSQSRDIELQSIFEAEYDATSSHTGRSHHDIQYQFAYTNYLQEAKFNNGTKKYRTKIIDYRGVEKRQFLFAIQVCLQPLQQFSGVAYACQSK